MGTKYFYPLEVMRLRNDAGVNNSSWGATYGMVRNGGTKPHQGWDLYAPVGTPAFAIASGVVQWVHNGGDYGKQVLVVVPRDVPVASGSDDTRTESIGAFYAHLSEVYVKEWDQVKGGQMIGRTGVTGNASPSYPHLHFELRTSATIPSGTDPFRGRMDPVEILGAYLLSCGSEQIGGEDLRQMVCTMPENAAKPIEPRY